jgi:hypothetical protein
MSLTGPLFKSRQLSMLQQVEGSDLSRALPYAPPALAERRNYSTGPPRTQIFRSI